MYFLIQQVQRNDNVYARRWMAEETSAAHKRAAAAEASQPHLADTSVSAGSQHHPAASVAGSRGDLPREDVDPELVVDYSGESMRYPTQITCLIPGLAPG